MSLFFSSASINDYFKEANVVHMLYRFVLNTFYHGTPQTSYTQDETLQWNLPHLATNYQGQKIKIYPDHYFLSAI